MIDIYRKILKLDYFETRKEKTRVFVFSLIMIVSIIIMLLDIYYGSHPSNHYVVMREVEIFMICLSCILYLFFPWKISLNFAVNIFSFFIIAFILSALVIPAYNQEFSLFALAIIPPILYFLLGLKVGKYWNIIIVLVLLFIVISIYYEMHISNFDTDLLTQILIAYIIISIFYYYVELERTNYEQKLYEIIVERDGLLKGKNVLLKEIHHRAKNNLQTIMGLLESQAMRLQDSNCKKVLRSQRHRLQSMSLLHENLAMDTSFDLVNMREYLTQIIKNLRIITDHDIIYYIESFRMPMSEAIHLALFLNEALSNAIEHAYKNDEKGMIEVNLYRDGFKCELCIKDYGKGFDVTQSYQSLGLVLMDDIIHFFNNARLEYSFEYGTTVCAYFNLKREEVENVTKT